MSEVRRLYFVTPPDESAHDALAFRSLVEEFIGARGKIVKDELARKGCLRIAMPDSMAAAMSLKKLGEPETPMNWIVSPRDFEPSKCGKSRRVAFRAAVMANLGDQGAIVIDNMRQGDAKVPGYGYMIIKMPACATQRLGGQVLLAPARDIPIPAEAEARANKKLAILPRHQL